jgi:ABC-type Na+ efflux pump permease subunit
VTRILRIAEREFLATVGTRAFILSMLITPVAMALLIYFFPRLIKQDAPMIEGEIAIVDATGEIAPALRANLQPDRIAKRREENYRRLQEALPPTLRSQPGGGTRTQQAVDDALTQALGEVPRLTVRALEPGADLEQAKAPLKTVRPEGSAAPERLALVVVHPDAVVRAEGKPQFGTYDLYVRGKLDDRLIDEISTALRDAIIDARVRRSGLDRAQVEALTKVDRVRSRTVTAGGENTTNKALNQLMPMAFIGLLLFSVMISGQYLLTTTVEEKANRVVEVLLSAVSPMQLMLGKILGQMAVGLVVLALYMGLGLMALLSFASLDLLDPVLIVYLFVFFLIAYVSVGAFMAAIGAAVNEIREAQGLMTPVMFILMVPWLLWMPISRDPNSMLALVLSFVPPFGNFVMMLRLASTSPPPAWQALAAVVVGAAGAVALLWFAAKVFRIGLLMSGKPPTFATLVRWARSG